MRQRVSDALLRLVDGFAADELCLDRIKEVEPDEMPAPYRTLLDHRDHMTTTLERYHGGPVTLRVLQHNESGDAYGRMILLSAVGTDHVVELGVVRMDLSLVPEPVRREILDRSAPLGEILIRHNVMRLIEPVSYLRLEHDHPYARRLSRAKDEAVYGRLGVIHCNDAAAIELLEVVTESRSHAAEG